MALLPSKQLPSRVDNLRRKQRPTHHLLQDIVNLLPHNGDVSCTCSGHTLASLCASDPCRRSRSPFGKCLWSPPAQQDLGNLATLGFNCSKQLLLCQNVLRRFSSTSLGVCGLGRRFPATASVFVAAEEEEKREREEEGDSQADGHAGRLLGPVCVGCHSDCQAATAEAWRRGGRLLRDFMQGVGRPSRAGPLASESRRTTGEASGGSAKTQGWPQLLQLLPTMHHSGFKSSGPVRRWAVFVQGCCKTVGITATTKCGHITTGN
ncbi:uncharacterized protein LOC118285953 [Scophthalmus maximus]|uniref:uncharacterized protein LOC118285953 n=1 Tax=Scophthalmus maximus TaxID=52904 RepID=UPI001FA8B82A|nr:uncharacterized protein LOC118285953 [Scophthalmus maximus]